MTDDRQHNVHAEVVQPELPVNARSIILNNIEVMLDNPHITATSYSAWLRARSAAANRIITALEQRGLLADDTELWERDLKAARAEVTFWQGQVTEAHESNARLMQEHNTVCALAVSLRDDIVRLVTAVLGTWDDDAKADEQIAEAERRVGELTRERDELITNLSEELAWLKEERDPDKTALGRIVGFEDAVRTVRQAFTSTGRPAAQEAGEPPPIDLGFLSLPQEIHDAAAEAVQRGEAGEPPVPREPRIWNKRDPEPEDRRLTVRDSQGDEWGRVREGWMLLTYEGRGPATATNVGPHPWSFVASFGPLTEVLEGGGSDVRR